MPSYTTPEVFNVEPLKQELLERKEKDESIKVTHTTLLLDHTQREQWAAEVFETLQLFLIVLHNDQFFTLIQYYEGGCVS